LRGVISYLVEFSKVDEGSDAVLFCASWTAMVMMVVEVTPISFSRERMSVMNDGGRDE
jgi:hypothetical protein